MSDLNQFDVAKSIATRVKNGENVFVEIIKGPNKGTVARVQSVNHAHYSKHMYMLSCEGKRPFQRKGDTLELLHNHAGETFHVENEDEDIEFKDNLGQIIRKGCALNFYRASKQSSGIEVVIGTVKEINAKGVFVQPFKIGSKIALSTEIIRVAKPECACVIEKTTLNNVLMIKLSAE